MVYGTIDERIHTIQAAKKEIIEHALGDDDTIPDIPDVPDDELYRILYLNEEKPEAYEHVEELGMTRRQRVDEQR